MSKARLILALVNLALLAALLGQFKPGDDVLRRRLTPGAAAACG